MQAYNPQQNRGRRNVEDQHVINWTTEGFGNSHEYEVLPQQYGVVRATVKAGMNNQRRIEQSAVHQNGDVSNEQQSYLRTLKDNNITEMVDDLLYPGNTSVDDRMSKFTSNMERKAKKSMEYQSGVTKDKFKRFFQQELDYNENREWWSDPGDVYSEKHVVF